MSTEPKESNREKHMSCDTNFETGIITVTFKTSPEVKREFDVTKLPDTMQKNCTVHGLKQKLVDSKAEKKGENLTAAQAMERVLEQWASLENNEWNRKGGGQGGIPDSIVNEAVLRFSMQCGNETAAAQSFVDALDADSRKAFRATPEIKAIIAEIQAEKAKAKLADAKPENSAAALMKAMMAPKETTPATA